MDDLDRLLERLCLARGAGYAGNFPEVMAEEIKKIGAMPEIWPDRSVLATIKGDAEASILIACHGDEIGLMVSAINEQGLIRMSEVGGCDHRLYPGQEVFILARELLEGFIAVKPPHLLSNKERTNVWLLSDLFVDTGLPAERVRTLVEIGDHIFFAGRYRRLNAELRSSKALDNRASVAAGILVLKELIAQPVRPTIHLVATSQEEFSGLGARLAANRLACDAAIVIDVTHGEFPDLLDGEYYPLNAGPALLCGGTIPPLLFNRLIKAARDLEIPHQIEVAPSWTGTDADAIAFNRTGVPTVALGIPLRYMHSPVEVVSLKDIERTARLTAEFIRRF